MRLLPLKTGIDLYHSERVYLVLAYSTIIGWETLKRRTNREEVTFGFEIVAYAGARSKLLEALNAAQGWRTDRAESFSGRSQCLYCRSAPCSDQPFWPKKLLLDQLLSQSRSTAGWTNPTTEPKVARRTALGTTPLWVSKSSSSVADSILYYQKSYRWQLGSATNHYRFQKSILR